MSVTDVQPIHPRRRSSWRNGTLIHTLLWLVTCDSQFDGPAVAIFADGIPQNGDVLVDGDSNVCPLTGIDVDPRNSADRIFEVLCEFTAAADNNTDTNPLDQPWDYAYSYNESTEPYFIDRSDPDGDSGTNNKPCVTSAGEAFQQFMTRERGELTITLTRNVASHNAAALDVYSHTINMATITIDGNGFATGVLKISPISAKKNVQKNKDGTSTTYYTQTLTFKARHQGWHDRPLDVGFNQLVGKKSNNTLSLQPIVDANGLQVTKPWPLNGSGAAMLNITDLPFTLDFEPYFAHQDWSALNIQ
jgi:hypothetical protein